MNNIEKNIKQVVIWGHINTHTHRFIHGAFAKAFRHLGFQTFQLDNDSNLSNMDFANTLFITEGQVDQNIPLIETSYYLVHNCKMEKYVNNIPIRNILILQVFTTDCLSFEKINNEFCYFENGSENKPSVLYMPWATDILPHEIDVNIVKLLKNEIQCNNKVNYVGILTDWYHIPHWDEVKKFCNENNIEYQYSSDISSEKNMEIIQTSLVAPAVQCDWQVAHGYIPCRIFKNISYGKMGLTNSKIVYELFSKKIFYHPDICELMKIGLDFEKNDVEHKKEIVIPLMEYVKEKHTYLNRIQVIFDTFNKIQH